MLRRSAYNRRVQLQPTGYQVSQPHQKVTVSYKGILQQSVAPPIEDGFQPGSPTTAVPQVKAPVRLEVTPSQMLEQSFQSNLAAMAAAGVPVEVVMVTEGSLSAIPTLQAPAGAAQAPQSMSNQARIQSLLAVVDTDLARANGRISTALATRMSQFVDDHGLVEHSIRPPDLCVATDYLDSAKRDYSQAYSRLNSGDLAEAERLGQSALNLAQRAMNATDQATLREHQEFQSKLCRARADAEHSRRVRDMDGWSYGGGSYSDSSYGGGSSSGGFW